MNIAVIDTETNWNNELMSVGCVIADAKELTPINDRYFIIDPEYLHGGMYSSALFLKEMPYCILSRQEMSTALIQNGPAEVKEQYKEMVLKAAERL